MSDRRIFLGIFVLCMSLLLFELSLIRIYSAILFYHFAFMAISVAMLGLAAAGLTVHLYPHRFTVENIPKWGFCWGAVYAVAIYAALWIVFRIPVNAYSSPDQIAGKLIIVYLLSAVPFYFAGLVISGLFSSLPQRAGGLYAWDLVGAGLGALAIIPLMNLIGGESAAFFIAALGFVAAALFAGRTWKVAAMLSALALILGLTNPIGGWLEIKYSKGQPIQNLDARYNRWNSFSRIMVIPFKIGTDAAPQTWGPSPKYTYLLPKMRHMSIMIDDGAATPVVPFDGVDLEKINYLKYDLTSLGHRLRGDGTTLVIGSGGGRDVLTGLMCGAKHIDAVDINPLIFEAMNKPLAEFSGNLFKHPKVNAVVAEGRSYARNHPNSYDLVQVAMIDTWAATTAGAYSLSENNLYTVEAFQDYIHALKPGGIISFTRFFFRPPRQALRLVSLFLEAAEREGIISPDKCILVGMHESLATLLFKTTPFTQSEIARFNADLDDMGFNLVYAPDNRPDPYFRQLVTMPDRRVFYEKYEYDVSPPTDDKPFFFNMLKMKNFLRVFEDQEGQLWNYYATYTLVILLIISIAATIIVLILPTSFKNAVIDRFPGRFLLLAYFIGIGLSYIMIEVTLLQRFVLLLEHPAYAASGVVAGMLISSGLGSMVWGRTNPDQRRRLFLLSFIVIVIGLLFHVLLGNMVIHKTIHLPIVVKVLVAVVLIAPLGWAMGIPLPAGITTAGTRSAGTVAWCWALNGAASVVASAMAVAIAMTDGFSTVLSVSLICYVMAFLFMTILISNKYKLSFAGNR